MNDTAMHRIRDRISVQPHQYSILYLYARWSIHTSFTPTMLFLAQAVSLLLVVHVSGKSASTVETCWGETCSFAKKSLVRAGRDRVLKNMAYKTFDGYANVSSSATGDIFTTEFRVQRGKVFSRISEGVVTPEVPAPGYPVPLTNYMKDPSATISYTARWSARKYGQLPRPSRPVGRLYSGALIHLVAPTRYYADTNTPRAPFNVEIFIWNRHDKFRAPLPTVACGPVPYIDIQDTYEVRRGDRGGDRLIFYFLKTSNPRRTDMDINTNKLFAHLIQHCKMKRNLDVVEINVCAEGQNTRADARFTAEIKSMGSVAEKYAVDRSSGRKNDSKPRGVPTETTPDNAPAPKNDKNESGGGGPNWELYGSIIGAVATIIAAILGVYLAHGKGCRGRRQTEGKVRDDGRAEMT